jgi:chitinase
MGRTARAVAALAAALLVAGAGGAAAAERPVVAGYLASWNATPARIAALPAARLTHVIYAFAKVTADGRAEVADPCRDLGRCLSARGGNFEALAALRAAHPHLEVLIALGGWTGSAHFSDAAATPAGRERLAASTVATFLEAHGDVFDGVDLDWEYPVEGGLPTNSARPEDRRNFTELVTAFRRALDDWGAAAGRRPPLTIATAASPWLMRHLEVEALAERVDWIGVMTYDYAVGAAETGFNAPLFAVAPEAPSVAATIDAYLAAGAPPERLVLGIPFYGRAFAGVAPGPAGDGLGQPGAPHAPAPWGPDALDWRRLVTAEPTAHGFRRHWHEVARVPWLYHRERGLWISHDDPRSVRHKAAYAALRGLKGVMIWELGGDDGRLIEAVADGLAAVSQPAAP